MKNKIFFSPGFVLLVLAVTVLFSSCYKKYNADDYAPLFVISGYSYVSEIAPTNLVAYWNFDDNLKDSVSNTAASGSNTTFAFILALILIYLILAAQFESFVDPFIIMFTVPLAISGAFISLYIFHQTLNIFSDIISLLISMYYC